jgi:large subunit ribosomal protein L21
MPATTATHNPTTAVIATGGKQYVVHAGQTVKVEKLELELGATVTFEPLMTMVDGTIATGYTVTANVAEHGKGVKIRISTYKSKKRQRRTIGHRQPFTALTIASIAAAKPAKKATEPAA